MQSLANSWLIAVGKTLLGRQRLLLPVLKARPRVFLRQTTPVSPAAVKAPTAHLTDQPAQASATKDPTAEPLFGLAKHGILLLRCSIHNRWGKSWQQQKLQPLLLPYPSLFTRTPCRLPGVWQANLQPLVRAGIVNRTYGIHKNLYICLFLLKTFGPIYYGPP